jgi:hypothetical protein
VLREKIAYNLRPGGNDFLFSQPRRNPKLRGEFAQDLLDMDSAIRPIF